MSPYCLPDSLLEGWLREDVPYGDLTSLALGVGEQSGRIAFFARQDMVVCGSEEARRLGELAGLQADGALLPSGTVALAGTPLLVLCGRADRLHAVWKIAQNLIEYLSGIATYTRELVDRARAKRPAVVIACTRKNFPGTKAAAIKAIYCGGAVPHRLGLSETVLVFPEHLPFVADPDPIEVVSRLRRQYPEKRLVVEVCSPEAAEAWIAACIDVVQLEKMSPEHIRALIEKLAHYPTRPVIAAAGGIRLENVADYAATGADVLVTSAPYLAPPRDVQVRFTCATA